MIARWLARRRKRLYLLSIGYGPEAARRKARWHYP